jgi:3-oxoacyl-[acyl-carrier-protein] synthase-1
VTSPVVITAAHLATGLGLGAYETYAAVRGGLAAFKQSGDFVDVEGQPVATAEFPLLEGLTDDQELETRLERLVEFSLGRIRAQLNLPEWAHRRVVILLGVPSPERPGLWLGDDDQHDETHMRVRLLQACARQHEAFGMATRSALVPGGNAAIFAAIRWGMEELGRDPTAIVIAGGCDSLVESQVVDWLDLHGRLKSAGFGTQHGVIPGEAVGFFALETRASSSRRAAEAIARIDGLGLAVEPAPPARDAPSTGDGLTAAVKGALQSSGSADAGLSWVVGDLNGEFERSRQWALAEARCLRAQDAQRRLWHPADCIGDTGSAAGVVNVVFAALGLQHGHAESSALVFGLDDFGSCGALVLGRARPAS